MGQRAEAFSHHLVSKLIDYALLKFDLDERKVVEACRSAKRHHFAAVCVHPWWVPVAARELRGSDVKVCAAIAFPFGATLPQVKALEARRAVEAGATELDVVMNIGAFKSGKFMAVLDELRAIVEVADVSDLTCDGGRTLVKVVIETSLLTEDEIKRASELVVRSGADFVKTNTGFGPRGATVRDVKLIREVVGNEMGVKAAGGIRTFQKAKALLDAGASRIGTSAALQIVRGLAKFGAGGVAGRAREALEPVEVGW